MTDFNMGFEPNGSMRFAAPIRERPSTRTPANVTADFLQALPFSPPLESLPTNRSRKRRETGNSSPTSSEQQPLPAAKRRRPALTATIDPISTAQDSPPAPPLPKVRQRKSKGKTAASRVIPRSLEDCDEADKMLISMRESGSDWNPIRAKWLELTGEKTATSTLPNRYARLKSNFTVIKEEDNGHLIAAKRQVEESFENQKWDLVAKVVEKLGGETYAGIVLKRQYKKLMVNAGAIPPAGVKDADYDGSDGED